MWRVICALAYTLAFVESSLKKRSVHLVGDNEVDLGPYDAKAQVGELPSLYTSTISLDDERRSANAAQTLELLRNFFSTGILNIPPIDPYKSNKVNVFTITSADTSLMTGKIEILEVLLKGVKSFNLKSLQIRMNNNLRADFDVEIPSLRGHVSFHTDLRVGGILPINVKGKLKFKIKEISVKGAVDAEETSLDDMEIYQLQNLDANIHADKIHVTLKGLSRSLIEDILRIWKMSNFENAPIIESTNNLIINYIAERVIEEVNKILKGCNVDLIKAFLETQLNLS